jgi:hypothetical protein
MPGQEKGWDQLLDVNEQRCCASRAGGKDFLPQRRGRSATFFFLFDFTLTITVILKAANSVGYCESCSSRLVLQLSKTKHSE